MALFVTEKEFERQFKTTLGARYRIALHLFWSYGPHRSIDFVSYFGREVALGRSEEAIYKLEMYFIDHLDEFKWMGKKYQKWQNTSMPLLELSGNSQLQFKQNRDHTLPVEIEFDKQIIARIAQSGLSSEIPLIN